VNKNVPKWNQVPVFVRKAFQDIGPDYDKAWFDKLPDEIRLTLLNLYAKMSKAGLWSYVQEILDLSPGCLHFECSNVEKLKAELTRRSDFMSPESSMDKWDSAEMVRSGSLHLKHFNWPSKSKVQAHVDHTWSWADPLGHLSTYSSYKNPFWIRKVLLDQGYDSRILNGSGLPN